MKLKEALKVERELPLKRPECGVHFIMSCLDEDDRDELTTAFLSEMTSVSITNALIASGYDIASTTVRRHRRGECRCT